MQDYSPLPVLHIHLMRLWTAWLEKCPEEFVSNPVIAVSIFGSSFVVYSKVILFTFNNLLLKPGSVIHNSSAQESVCFFFLLFFCDQISTEVLLEN